MTSNTPNKNRRLDIIRLLLESVCDGPETHESPSQDLIALGATIADIGRALEGMNDEQAAAAFENASIAAALSRG